MLCTHLVGIRINQQQTPIFLLWMCLQTLYLFLEGSESFSAAKGRSAILGRVSFWVLRDGQNVDSNGSKYAALFIRHEYMEHGWLHSWPLQALRSSCPRGCPWHHCRWSCHIPVRFLPDHFLLQSLSLHGESNFLEGILCNKSIHKCSNFPPLFSTCKNLQKMVHFFLFLNLYPFFSLQSFLNNWVHWPFYFCILNCVFFFSIWLLQRWIGDHVAVASLGRSCIWRRQVLTCQSNEGTHLDFGIYKRRQLVLGLELGLLVFQGFIHGVLRWKKWIASVGTWLARLQEKPGIVHIPVNCAEFGIAGFSEFCILGVTRSVTMIWWEWRPCQLHWSLHST